MHSHTIGTINHDRFSGSGWQCLGRINTKQFYGNVSRWPLACANLTQNLAFSLCTGRR